MSAYHPTPGAAGSTPRLVLTHRGGDLVASLEQNGATSHRLVLPGVCERRLGEIVAEHRASFEPQWLPEPYEVWTSATEKFLNEVYDLISSQLVPILAAHPRVALQLDGPILARLPIETAHRPGGAALFEFGQVYRAASHGACPSPAIDKPRSFSLRFGPADQRNLDTVLGEQEVVNACWSHRRDTEAQPLIHVSGHSPSIPASMLRPDRQAHLVLSGCDSLPDSTNLALGVASVTGSLWPVDDHTNAQTMSIFHARLAAGLGPVEALRQTQLHQRRLSPTVWAAYAHIGLPI